MSANTTDQEPHDGGEDQETEHGMVDCPNCDGAGVYGGVGTSGTCPVCHGTGRVDAEYAEGFDRENFYSTFDWADYEWGSIDEFLSGVFDGVTTFEGFDQSMFDLRAEAVELESWNGLPLEDVDFSGLDLQGSDFSECSLSRINFRGVPLSGADFSGASLEDVDFSGADLSGANFDGADVSGSFKNANLKGATFYDVTFDEAIFTDATFDQTSLVSCIVSGLAGITLPEGMLRQVDFGGRSLRFSGLPGADLRDARFVQTELEHFDLSNANLAGADFSNARLKSVTFDGADLSGANFDGAHFHDTLLNNAKSLRDAQVVRLRAVSFTDRALLQGACQALGAQFDDSVALHTDGLHIRETQAQIAGEITGRGSVSGMANAARRRKRDAYLREFKARARERVPEETGQRRFARQHEFAWLAVVEALDDEISVGNLQALAGIDFVDLMRISESVITRLDDLGFDITHKLDRWR